MPTSTDPLRSETHEAAQPELALGALDQSGNRLKEALNIIEKSMKHTYR